MLSAYDYLFYKYYQWSIIVNGKAAFHKINACLMMSAPIYIYAFSFFILFFTLQGMKPPSFETAPPIWKPILIFGAAFPVFANQILFSHKNRYEIILNKYKSETASSARIGNVIVTIFTIGSIALLFFTIFLSLP